jgi:hypothetical protein
MSEIKLPKPTAMDLVHRVVKAGLSAVPVVGGPTAELFDYFIRPPLSKRQDEFLYSLAVGLEQLQKKGIVLEKLNENPKFVTVVTQAMLISLRNHQKEKLEALQSAILNATTSDDTDLDIEMIFLNLIDEFTPSHLELLDYLDTNEFNIKGIGLEKYITPDIYNAVKSFKPKFEDVGFFNLVIKDLVDRGLVNPMTISEEEEVLSKVTTNLGERFLKYIRFSG